jgi:hypothetical protein
MKLLWSSYMNLCHNCNKERHPKAKPGECQTCYLQRLHEEYESNVPSRLDQLGFDLIKRISGRGSHQRVEVSNRECGHIFEVKFNNLFSNRTKCAVCGPTKRMAHALKYFIKKHGRTYDLKEWNDYRTKVRQLSEHTYKSNLHILNPQNLQRSKGKDYNLDHKVPIIICFKNKIEPEIASCLENLQILSARSNLSKNKHKTDKPTMQKLILLNQSFTSD